MLVHHWEPTFSLNFSLRAANLAVRFSLFASIFWFSFSWACLLKLQLSSMAFWMTSFSCSRFSARCFSTSASWLWQTDKTTVALYRILNTRATLFFLVSAYKASCQSRYPASFFSSIQFPLNLIQWGFLFLQRGQQKIHLSVWGRGA